MIEYVNLKKIEFGLNTLQYVSLPVHSYDCSLMSSGVKLDIL